MASSSPSSASRTKRKNSNGSGNNARPSLLCVRLSIVFLLAAISALSVYFSYTLTLLTVKVQDEQSVITDLQNKLSAQEIVVNRFNESVTNADVKDQVNELEASLKETEADMLHSLDATTASIHALLNSTVQELDDTVKEAQKQIHDEVILVKQDVDKYVRSTQDQFSMENSFMVYQLAGTFTLLVSLISMWHMTAHLRQFKQPSVQRRILAILWMSPIYGVTSWLSLVFPKFEGYLAIIKDFYEAYIIYCFLGFCISVLGKGDRETVVNLLARHTDHLDPPIRCCGWFRGKYPYQSPKQLSNAVLLQCQVFAMQFVFFKPLTAVAMFACNKLGYYGGGSYKSPQFWINIVQNISVFLAFSGLLKFYHAVQDDLSWCRPFPKFLCIKGIVFMTFWQGLVIALLANSSFAGNNASSDGSNDDPDIWAKQAQNFLICLEMLLFSIAHFYCFPVEEWQDGYRPDQNKSNTTFGDNMALGDFVADLKLIMRGNKQKKGGKVVDSEDKKITSSERKEGGSIGLTEEEKEIKDSGKESKPKAVADGEETNVDDLEEGNILADDGSKDDDDSADGIGGMIDRDFNNASFDEDDMTNLSISIQQSLTAASAEEREAANRILRNSKAILGQISEEKEAVTSDDNDVENVENTYGAMPPMGSVRSNRDHNEEDDEETPDETTSLLGSSGTRQNDFLQPSIFTTTGDMGAMNNFSGP